MTRKKRTERAETYLATYNEYFFVASSVESPRDSNFVLKYAAFRTRSIHWLNMNGAQKTISLPVFTEIMLSLGRSNSHLTYHDSDESDTTADYE